MEQLLLITLLIIIFFLVIILMFLKKNINKTSSISKEELNDIRGKLERMDISLTNQVDASIGSLNSNLSRGNLETANILKNTTDSLDKKISNQNVEQLNVLRNTINTLEHKLQLQNEQSSKYIQEIITRVTSLDNIKSQMLTLNDNISSLEKVLSDKKARGTFGEVRLKQIFEAVFGEGQKNIYEEQRKLSNGKIVDFVLHGPYPIGDIAIDSKFPLENYLNINKATNDIEIAQAQKNFKKDLKKHIDDIASKYIIDGETTNQAMMFIPAEAIFSYINANGEDIINYSYKKKVWITSPTTIMAILNLMLVVLKDIKRNESYVELYDELTKLKVEFDRYATRWQDFNKSIEKVYKVSNEIGITSNKIVKRFEQIENMEINQENTNDQNDIYEGEMTND